jgi:pimeloyl-ACP methyl ester carboxylesterase
MATAVTRTCGGSSPRASRRATGIVLFDHVGHGGSDASAFDAQQVRHSPGYCDDLLAICKELDSET